MLSGHLPGLRRFFVGMTVSLGFTAVAAAEDVVVWLDAQPPEARDLRRVEAETGTVRHLSQVDLMFPPAPLSARDGVPYDALRSAFVDGTARWQGWDVETQIAEKLRAAIDDVSIVRDDADLRTLVDANLLLGAASDRVVAPELFASDERTASLRLDIPGGPVNRGWASAITLDPERQYVRADIADGSPYEAFIEVQRRVEGLPEGTLDLSDVPVGAQAFVDGVGAGLGNDEIALAPGRHWFHIVRGGVVSGRTTVDVSSGLRVSTPVAVDEEELAAARAALSGDLMGSLPDDVKSALDAIGRQNRGGVFVAMAGEGRPVVRPYRNAELEGQRLLTVVGSGEVGFGLMTSPLFDSANGQALSVPGANASVGLELGISYVALIAGLDLDLTPTATITLGNTDQTENTSTSVYPMPYLGLGAYLLRPNRARATLLVAGNWAYVLPAHSSLGGRAVLGIPMDDKGTWFRLTVGGLKSGNVVEAWRQAIPDVTPMSVFFTRLGFGARF